jgi:hypothetical protein
LFGAVLSRRGAMEGERNQKPEVASPAALGRRKFLFRAAVAGTAAWAVPTIITMEPAGAASLTSPPPTPPVVVQGETVIAEVEARGSLPVTGAPITTLLGAGAAAIVGGGAMHEWSARATSRDAARPDAGGQPGSQSQPAE